MSDYCTRADIEAVYGVGNVAIFADLDGDADSTKIANRIASVITQASIETDEYARSTSYHIPLTTSAGATPSSIKDITARLAGLLMYEPRGLDGYSPDGKPNHKYYYQREYINQFWQDVRNSVRILDAERG